MFPPLRHISPQLPRRLAPFRPAVANFLTRHGGLLICALFLLAGLNLAGDYGLDPDEPNQRETATSNLDYILGRVDRIESWNYHDRVYGVAFELPLLLIERALGLADYHYIHRLRATLIHLFFILGAFFFYRLAYRLFNNRLIALLALLIYLLHPRLYAHSFFNAKDLPFLTLFVLALYLLERAFRRNTPAAFLLLGIAVGLLVNIRVMGIMLFPAVIAMRGLDLFYAGGRAEGKQILLTAGLFILAAGLSLYAVTPYAWLNPLDYLRSSLDLTVNHPSVWPQLFQGQWYPSDQLPPHYNPTWFSITMPPLFLLLGGIGAAIVVARIGRRPPAVFRNTRRRFFLLLLAGFLLPPLAAALLSSNQYNDWRHLYFIYAPFCLLAAGGLGWLAAALARQPRCRAGMYGLTGLGLALVLLQITQLHPTQQFYFNFLVDRATPEYLRSQYNLNLWELARRAALQQILEIHPDKTLWVRIPSKYQLDEFPLLPAADRQRLLPALADRQADYLLADPMAPSQPDRAFNTGFGRVYNSASNAALRPLRSSLMTPAAVAAYREIYRQALASEPVIRADYNVYRHGQRLTFVKANCPPDSPDAWFGARHFPPDPEILPPNAGEIRFYISYRLGNYAVRLDNACLALIQLPPAARGYLILSQHHLDPFRPEEPPLWTELYGLTPPDPRQQIAQLRQNRPPPPPNAFAAFLSPEPAGGYRLLYAKADCAPAEYETRVFLHIHPENPADLPFYQWQSGVDNREFPLRDYGVRSNGECIAVYPLPDYPIAALLTGQTGLWEANLYPPANPNALRAAAAALAAVQPNARAPFNLYIQNNRLLYLRETCNAADTAANFFLHITPQDTADLPAERQAAGFANQDFPFARYGGPFDGKCLAAIPLPNYPIAAIRTGQYVAGQGEVWAAELALER